MITQIASQFLQLCVSFLFALFDIITFDYFEKDNALHSDVDNLARTMAPSENVKVFPLLRLPLVAREHVLCMMTPFELIHLSMTSSRARQAVTFFSRIKSRFWVGIGIHGSPFIDIKESRRIGKAWCYSWTSNPTMVGQSTNIAFESIHKFSKY
uniref:F-box domain-containing protein n=1 Tax=Caenorhabditis tropicalis TaxID=1561998 RepID=A0A1I7TUL8_9PELO